MHSSAGYPRCVNSIETHTPRLEVTHAITSHSIWYKISGRPRCAEAILFLKAFQFVSIVVRVTGIEPDVIGERFVAADIAVVT